jgi:SAM-dependent methyltransferase
MNPGASQTFSYPVVLENKHLGNCVLLKDRYEILAFMPKNAKVAEVGVLGGDFSEHILQQTNPEQLYLIDTFNSPDWASHDPGRFKAEDHFDFIKKRFHTEIEKNQVQLMKGISWDCLAELEDNLFDWIYLDADHRYRSVKKDLEQALRLVKPDGYIVLNDYIFYSHVENTEYGVIHAANEVCVNEGFEMIYLALHPQMYCDVVLRRIKV